MNQKMDKLLSDCERAKLQCRGATDSRETGEMFRGFGRKILWLCTEGTSAWLLHGGGGSLPTEHLLWGRAGTTKIYFRLNCIEKSSFDLKISNAPTIQRPAVFCRQAASRFHVFALNQLKSNHNDKSNFFKIHFNVFHLQLVPTSFLFPLTFLITSLYPLLTATCPTHLDVIRLFLQANKAGKPKYSVRAKRKYLYWQINLCNCLLSVMCVSLDKTQK
jgi:hypothetical protein